MKYILGMQDIATKQATIHTVTAAKDEIIKVLLG